MSTLIKFQHAQRRTCVLIHFLEQATMKPKRLGQFQWTGKTITGINSILIFKKLFYMSFDYKKQLLTI